MVKALLSKPRIWTTMIVVALLVYLPAANSQTRRGSGPQRTTPQTTAAANAQFDQIVKQADEARLAERLDDAISLYGQALKIRPKWPDGWWYIGAILYEKDSYVEAKNSFQNVVALDPKRGLAWGMLGLCQFQVKDYEQSVRSLQRARSLGMAENREIESVVRYHTALLYIRFEEFEIAFTILSEFMRVGNESPKVVEAFGLTLLRMPFLPTEIPPDKREEVLIAGQAGFNMASRRLDQARAAFDTLLARYPNEPNVHYSYGVYLLNQDSDKAMQEFKRELEISPSHYPSMVQMAFEYFKRGQFNDALPLAEKGVQLAPKMFAARNVFGRTLLELGQVDKAIVQLEEGVRLAPASPEMHFALARAYTRAGRKDDAAREREIFKGLQDKLSQERDAQKPGTEPGTAQETPKP